MRRGDAIAVDDRADPRPRARAPPGRDRTLTRRPRRVTGRALIDARRGLLRLSYFVHRGCEKFGGSGRFAGARFRLEKDADIRDKVLNQLRLVGGLRVCGRANGVRTMRVSARGESQFHVFAQRLEAFNSGRARYAVSDTCRRTSVVRVHAGRVYVKVKGRQVRVRPGRKYVVRVG